MKTELIPGQFIIKLGNQKVGATQVSSMIVTK